MFSVSTHASSINYRDTFRPLIALHEKTDLLNLIGTDAIFTDQSSPSSSVTFLASYFFTSSQTSPSIGKLFRRKIKEWIEDLDKHLEINRFNPTELSLLQEAVKPIYYEGKTTILKRKIEEAEGLSPKTKKILEKLDEYLLRILRAPHVAKIAQAEPDSSASAFTGRSFTYGLRPFGLAGICAGRVSSRTPPVDPATIHQEMKERTRHLQVVRRVKEVTLFNHRYSNDWEDSFIKAADELCQEKELVELGRQVSALQLIALISSYLINQREGWKLLFIIGSLDSSILIEMLTTLDASQLCILNTCLKRGVRQHPDWFAEAIKRQAETFLHRCSEIEESVEGLAERFTSDDKCHQLRSSDLQLIRQLRDTARLRHDCLSKKLSRVYADIIADDKICAQLTEELPSRYRLLLKRLTDTQAPEGNLQNCLLPIIYGKVFDSSEFTPEDKAFEMLGEWSIILLPHYFKTGLFGNISKAEFDQMVAAKKPSELYQLAIDNLSFLGIELISDWKRMEIFNGRILKDYLKEEGRSLILRKRSFSRACHQTRPSDKG